MDMHANVTQHVQDAGWLRAVDLVDHSPLSSTPWLDGWRSVFRAPMQALHDDRTTRRVDTFFETARRRASQAVRCPVCQWRPTASSEWLCDPTGTPEPPFAACGTVWNTFATRGRCPGCAHQWHWTTCHRCGVCSPHDDWYDSTEGDDA